MSGNEGDRAARRANAGAARGGAGMESVAPEIDAAALAAVIDHTLLAATAREEDVLRLCEEAAAHRFAAVCVNSMWVPLAARALRATGVAVAAVVGFPLGAMATAAKAYEAAGAIAGGAREIDVVLPVGPLKAGDDEVVGSDIAAVVASARAEHASARVKVILETCYLTDAEKVRACRLAVAAGADFVKTSTGFGAGGATPEDVALLRASVPPSVGVKAAGGIRTARAALVMLRAGASRLGTSSGVAILRELAGRAG